MYVLDRLRSVEQGCLVVPPFHTAPCGLLPGAQVHVSVAETGEGITVMVRPYQSSQDNLMLLTAILRNEPPVEITRIMEPVSSLGINIVNAFSSVIDDLQEQHVCMVLDWSTSKEHARKRPALPGDRRKYRDYHSVFPILVDRYVKLFEAIQKSCGAQLAKRPDGSGLPLLTLEEIANPPNLLPCGAPEVERFANDPRRRFYVKIALPAFLLAKLRIGLEVDDDARLRYHLLSDTRTRTLRAFFPRPEAAHDSVHLAFFHMDAPGTFSSILRPFETAGFRVLNSMVRHDKDGRNVLDAVMRVPAGMIPDNLRGGDEVRPSESLCRWAARTMLEHAEPRDADLFRRCSLDIGAPLYPAPKAGEWSGSVSVTALLAEGSVLVGSKRRSLPVVVNGNGAHADQNQSTKADFVRLHVQRNHVRGVSAGELYDAFQDAGVVVQRGYLHTLLHRLREQKSIRYFDKRYYPFEEMAVEESRR